MAELAIKGHKERGKEVIALLEMLGGKNNPDIPYDGSGEGWYYFITKEGNINSAAEYAEGFAEKHLGLTLESFEEQFPYKVGDIVIGRMFGKLSVIGMKWNETIRSILYSVQGVEGEMMFAYAQDLSPYKLDPIERSPDKAKAPVLQGEDYSEGRCGYKIPEGFEFDKVEDGEVILKPKKKELPKTYRECCKILDLPIKEVTLGYATKEERTLFRNFIKLMRCRKAYWKLADDWNPVWNFHPAEGELKYCICLNGSALISYSTLTARCALMFPTEEMRNTFLENFRDLIRECEELL